MHSVILQQARATIQKHIKTWLRGIVLLTVNYTLALTFIGGIRQASSAWHPLLACRKFSFMIALMIITTAERSYNPWLLRIVLLLFWAIWWCRKWALASIDAVISPSLPKGSPNRLNTWDFDARSDQILLGISKRRSGWTYITCLLKWK